MANSPGFLDGLLRAINESAAVKTFGSDFRTRIPREQGDLRQADLKLAVQERLEKALQIQAEKAGLDPATYLAQRSSEAQELDRGLTQSQIVRNLQTGMGRRSAAEPDLKFVQVPDPEDPSKKRMIAIPENDPRFQGEGIEIFQKPSSSASGGSDERFTIEEIPDPNNPGRTMRVSMRVDDPRLTSGIPQPEEQPASTFSERKEARSLDAVQTLVSRLMDLSLGPVNPETGERQGGINAGSGFSQKATGGGRRVASALGMDDEVLLYRDELGGFVPMLARLVGHSGVLTEIDVERTERLFPQPGNSRGVAESKWEWMREIMSGKRPLMLTPTDENGNPTGPLQPHWMGQGPEGSGQARGAGPSGLPPPELPPPGAF